MSTTITRQPLRYPIFLLAALVLAETCGGADEDPRFARDGLVLNWQTAKLQGVPDPSSLPDDSGQNNDAVCVNNARFAEGPPRIELDGSSSIVGSKPIRVERISIEAAFRIDRAGGPMQLIVTTFAPQQRIGAGRNGNGRQWVMEIRGRPFQRGSFEGYLEFGIFGEDQRWHISRSHVRPRRGWHHAVGTFDGRAARFYLDGRLQGRTIAEYVGKMNIPPDGIINVPAVGSNGRNSDYGLQGAVALTRIYSRALSPKEIAQNRRYAQTLVPQLAEDERRRSQRMKAPFKVLFSNDFTNMETCTSPYHKRGERFRPEMLEATVDEVAGADVHMLQPCTTWVPWWPSKVYPMKEHREWWMKFFKLDPVKDEVGPMPVHQYILDGGDPFKVYVARCRKVGQHPFISVRMNDGHHLQFVECPKNKNARHCICRFYAEHPEYRIGPDIDDWNQHVHNWAIPEAREYKLALIRELIERYDIDGMEMDFMRHPSYFRLNETTREQRAEIMAGVVRDIRAALDAKGGPHRWLCARVPCLLRLHDDLGIDLPEMVDAGLDMVNLSPSYFTQQQHDVALVRELVPEATIYLEMCHCTMTGRSVGGYGDNRIFSRTADQQFYTTAHVAYRRGADGMSLFNFVYFREHGQPGRGPYNEPPFHVLERLGDPEWLAKQPQWYVLAKAYNTSLARKFCVGLSHTFRLDMAPTEHQTKDAVFRLMTEEDSSKCRWEVRINGTQLSPRDFVRKPIEHPYEGGLGDPKQYACFACPRDVVKGGANEIAVTLTGGPAVVVQYLDLVLP